MHPPETPNEPPPPAEDRVLSEFELRRERQEYDRLTSELKDLVGGMHQRFRVAMAYLIGTGAFSEQDLQLMMRAQAECPEFALHPCQVDDSRDQVQRDEEKVERRRYFSSRFGEPLSPAPVARHRLHCPLYERGRKGDPLVPCAYAQQANPNYPRNERLKEAPFLPADLDEVRRLMINFFCNVGNEDLFPCKVVQALCQYDMTQHLEEGRPDLYQIRPPKAPPPPQPPPELRGDLALRRHLQIRQAALEEAARLEAATQQHHRELLRHLIQTGRLTRGDLVGMTYDLLMVTDEGWLPCRDDPQRTHTDPIDVDGKEHERDEEAQRRGTWVDVAPQRKRCELVLRALDGDRTVPCCEAQKVRPSPARLQQRAEEDARHKREYAEFWARRGGPPASHQKPPEEVCFTGQGDEPGGPLDIVRLLHIRPCYLLGRTAATYLYKYGEYLWSLPEMRGL